MRINKLQMNNRFLSARLNFSAKASTVFSSRGEESAEQLSSLNGICDGNDG